MFFFSVCEASLGAHRPSDLPSNHEAKTCLYNVKLDVLLNCKVINTILALKVVVAFLLLTNLYTRSNFTNPPSYSIVIQLLPHFMSGLLTFLNIAGYI